MSIMTSQTISLRMQSSLLIKISHTFWSSVTFQCNPDCNSNFFERNYHGMDASGKICRSSRLYPIALIGFTLNLSLPGCYIRWDITWLLMKSLWRLNRHGPSFSNFYSFALKCINDLLPTGTNLSKRISGLYDNWSCPFCNTASETLQHFLTCSDIRTVLVWHNLVNIYSLATNFN